MRSLLLILFCTTVSIGQINGIYTHPYPRIMAFTMERIGRPEYAARFDVAIMSPLDSNTAKEIHAINPHTYCLATRNWTQGAIFWKPGYDTTTIPDEWKLRSSSGALCTSDDPPYPIYNVTQYCGRYSGTVCGYPVGTAAGLSQGETYGEAIARLIVKNWSPDVWDGYSSDGTAETPSNEHWTPDADVERNGTNAYSVHGMPWVTAAWQAGWNSVYRDIRTRLGGKNRLLLYHSIQDTFGLSWMNGAGLENGNTHAPGNFAGWKALQDQFDAGTKFLPRVSWSEETIRYDSLHAPARKHDYFRYVRWSLGYTSMTNAYYNIGDLSSPWQGEHLWTPYYDEFNLQLGQATGKAQQIGSTGVWVRFFDNGCVIVNTSSTTRTVTDLDIRSLSGYAGTYSHFRGNQDPVWNDGSIFSAVTLLSTPHSWPGGSQNVGDAVFLLKSPATIVSDVIVDNAYSGTSPGTAPTDFAGTWSLDGNQPYPNSAWEITAPQRPGYPEWYYLLTTSGGTGTATATSTPTINVSGDYRVYEWHAVRSGAATNVPCTIFYAGGTGSRVINQSANTGQWNLLGTYAFNSGGNNKIVLTNAANGTVIADAFKFEYGGPPNAPPTAPKPSRPPGGAINQPVDLFFGWGKSESAQFYRFQLAYDPSFSASSLIADDSMVTDTLRFVPGLPHETQFFWRVSSRNSFGSSGWSGVMDFTSGPPSSFIAGTVFFDKNNNGVRDASEPGLPGWIIDLQGSALPPAVSDSAGKYRFDHLYPGSYTVSEEGKYGWAQTLPSSPSIYPVIITWDVTVDSRDFGIFSSNPIATSVRKGWNLISVPMEVPDMRKWRLFPSAMSGASSYDDGYVFADTMQTGVGYWMKFPQNQILRATGNILTADTIQADEGWNLIGTIGIPISSDMVATIPDGSLASPVWGYNGGFASVDSLLPGLGYWVKVRAACKIIVSASNLALGKNRHAPPRAGGTNSLTFTSGSGESQKLYFSSMPDPSQAGIGPLPPEAPGGSFDVRFFRRDGDQYGSAIANFSDSAVTATDVPIRVKSGSTPLTISWEIASNDGHRYSLRMGNRELSLGLHGELELKDSLMTTQDHTAVLLLRAEGGIAGVSPSAIELFPNYPNPFNNSTSIRFNLPQGGDVHLNVYDMLGQQVRSLVQGTMEPGSHVVSFDASGLASGVYLYRLEVENSRNRYEFKQNRMILMK